jgi:hypothetical protein
VPKARVHRIRAFFVEMRKELLMTKFLLMIVVIACLLLGVCCKDEPTKPPPEDTIKDPRTYTWTIDTLAYPGSMQTNMQDIWASSPTNVYVVGRNERGYGKMYHFDGTRWTDVKLSTTQGGTIQGAIDLFGIYGFGSNDVYAVGERIYDNFTPPPNFLDSSLLSILMACSGEKFKYLE